MITIPNPISTDNLRNIFGSDINVDEIEDKIESITLFEILNKII
jgi:hypothetical protein